MLPRTPPHPGGQPANRGPHSCQARWPTIGKGKSKSWLTMKAILILICSSISGVVREIFRTNLEIFGSNLVLADDSTSCVTNIGCKYWYSDGYAFKIAGSTQDMQTATTTGESQKVSPSTSPWNSLTRLLPRTGKPLRWCRVRSGRSTFSSKRCRTKPVRS